MVTHKGQYQPKNVDAEKIRAEQIHINAIFTENHYYSMQISEACLHVTFESFNCKVYPCIINTTNFKF
jgi:hypothetical protein